MLDQKLDSLRPGQTLKISECNGVQVFAERSGNGKTLRFFRQRGSTTTVFKTVAF